MSRKREAVLWVLSREPGMYALDIARVIGVWRINIYILLGGMEEDGLIRHEHDGERWGRFRYYVSEQ